MHSLDTLRLLGSALLPRTVNVYGLATAGAMLTCVAIVLNVGPFVASPNKAHNIEGARGPAGRQAAAIAEEPHGSVPRWDVAALIESHRSPAAAEAEDTSARISALVRPSPFAAIAEAPAAAQPAAPGDAGDPEGRIVQTVWGDPVAPPQPEPAGPDLTRDAIVGVWAPDGSCSARNFRDGLLPTVINPDGAWAGETFCLFSNRKQTDTGWTVVAKCQNPTGRWTSNVRLTVNENRLTWTSRRGTQAYTRCAPDVAMAQAR